MKNRLSEIEYNEVLDCIEAIYRCRNLENFPTQVLIELRKLIHCDLSGYNEVNLKRNRALVVFDPPRDELTPLLKNFESHLQEHPVISYFSATGDGQTLKISDFLTVREYHKLSIYKELYRYLGAEDQISFGVRVEPGFIIGIAFNRGKRSFTEKDRLRLNLIRPHLVQAYLHAAEIAGRREKERDLQAAMSDYGLGVIALNAGGGIIHSTPGAFECLSGYVPVPEEEGLYSLPEHILRWARVDGDTASGGGNSSAPFTVSSGSSRLVIRKVRYESRTLLLLSEENGPDVANRLMRFQLTRRESEVLGWVAQGKSNSEIAKILGLTTGTVKLHVERILTKLGVENRTAAAMAVSGANY